MQTNRQIYLLTAAFIQVLVVMFVLPWFSYPGYSIIRNTVSELGGQFAPHAWIMNYTFVLLALGCVIAGWSRFEGFVLHRALLLLFSTSLLLMAIFNQAPADSFIRYNIREAFIHTYFAGTAGILFTILSIATSFVVDTQFERFLATASGLSALILIILTSESDHTAGIWQRLLFIITFGWMLCNFKIHE